MNILTNVSRKITTFNCIFVNSYYFLPILIIFHHGRGPCCLCLRLHDFIYSLEVCLIMESAADNNHRYQTYRISIIVCSLTSSHVLEYPCEGICMLAIASRRMPRRVFHTKGHIFLDVISMNVVVLCKWTHNIFDEFLNLPKIWASQAEWSEANEWSDRPL